jgi:hypothetical protein
MLVWKSQHTRALYSILFMTLWRSSFVIIIIESYVLYSFVASRQKIHELREKKSSKSFGSKMRQLSLVINQSCSNTHRVHISFVSSFTTLAKRTKFSQQKFEKLHIFVSSQHFQNVQNFHSKKLKLHFFVSTQHFQSIQNFRRKKLKIYKTAPCQDVAV